MLLISESLHHTIKIKNSSSLVITFFHIEIKIFIVRNLEIKARNAKIKDLSKLRFKHPRIGLLEVGQESKYTNDYDMIYNYF